MNTPKTIPVDDWTALCELQVQRAQAGDQRAATWCAQNAPAIDATKGWQAYNKLWKAYDKLTRAYERTYELYRGVNKLHLGYWTEGCAAHKAWAQKLQDNWNDPAHRQDMKELAADFSVADLSDEAKEDFADAMTELLLSLCESKGLPKGKWLTVERALRTQQGFLDGTLDRVVAEIKAELGMAPAPVAPAKLPELPALPAEQLQANLETAQAAVKEDYKQPVPPIEDDLAPAPARNLDSILADCDDQPRPPAPVTAPVEPEAQAGPALSDLIGHLYEE